MSPEADLRTAALGFFDAGVTRADPEVATRAALEDRSAKLEAARRVVLLALGKAGIAMARAALPYVEHKLARGVVVTTEDVATELAGLEVVCGGHPVPDEGSLDGGRRLVEAAHTAQDGDLVLVLVSGGGSALAVAPPDGVSLEDKMALSDLLLKSGADITQMNTVRGNVSTLKSGGLARAAAPAEVLALLLSDVPGDDPAVIASGPTATETPGRAAAIATLAQFGLSDDIPRSVRAHLDRAEDRTPAMAENVVIGSNDLSVAAVERAIERTGRRVIRLPGWLGGDVGDAAQTLFDRMHEAAGDAPLAIVAGGETTVRVSGGGSGGRNQEMALRMALLAETRPIPGPWCFLSGGTDGRDGPTRAAGGLVDAGTLSRMRDAGIDPEARLSDNDANPALAASGDLIETGQTGTNVADIQIALLG